MRVSRFVRSPLLLERVWQEATVRVAREDEMEQIVRLMCEHENVHDGERGKGPRSWGQRVTGRHRCTMLLEHNRTTLAYILVSTSPVVASSMHQIFSDSWEEAGEKGAWRNCNFYSINSVAKDLSHPFAKVPVGFPLISKAGEYLRKHGVQRVLQDRAKKVVESDELDVSAEPQQARLYTMSPVPSLRDHLAKSKRSLLALAEDNVDKCREDLEAYARELIAARRDPVAKFHLGNGASLLRLNWKADDSPLRMRQSFGLMCNYDYNGSAQ
jgi:hypothetical protein